MIIINFAHPLTARQCQQIEEMANEPITAVYDTPCQFENSQPLLPQVKGHIDDVPLTSTQWQTEPLLVNPPGLAPAATVLLAELHGRLGYFPTIIRIRPILGSTPTRYEVAELLNLQSVRDTARRQR
ncbi:MAG: hypothetical protein KC415_23575 [Anaerolineales bacterium]|nr:hypothetical protein [Anaerolineales bacterium]